MQLPPLGRTWPFIHPLPGRFALVRVPELADPRLGMAVLLYRRGHTLIYCPQDDITERASRVLSALTGQVLEIMLGGGRADPGPHITVNRIDHSQLPADRLHVASVQVHACADLIHVLAEFVETRAYWDEAIAAYTIALQASRDLDDPARSARALLALSAVLQQTGQYEAALPLAGEAAEIYRALADRRGEAGPSTR